MLKRIGLVGAMVCVSLAMSGWAQDASPGVARTGVVQEFRLSKEFTPAAIPDAPSSTRQDRPHGRLYGYLGSSLMSPDVTPAALPLSQFGGAIGGDLGGSTSYFVSYDQIGLNRQRLMESLASQMAVGGVGLLDPANLVSSAFAGRMDHRFGQGDSAYVRFSRDAMRGNSLNPALALPQTAKGLNVTQTTAAAGNTASLSPRTTDESRAQFVSTDVELPAGTAALGLGSADPQLRHNRIFEAANNLYRQVGSQSLRLGGDFLYNQMNLSLLQSSLGRMALGQSTRDVGFYVQGQRQLRPDLVVTTGARYDLQTMRGFKTDLNNFSPQVGFAWSPGSSRTVIRGGFGMYYDRVPLPAFAGSGDPASAANLSRSAVLRGTGSAAQMGVFTTVSPMIQNSYAEHASLQAEQQIGAHSVLSGGYEYVRGVQLALPVQRTAELCATTSVCSSQNEFMGQQIGTGAVSSYKGFTAAFAQEPLKWGNYKVSYTYSVAEGAGTGANLSYLSDQMRRLSFTGVLHTALSEGSTPWQRLTHGFLLTGTADYSNRSEFLGMSFINVNARLSKSLVTAQGFRLEGMVETFNMLQRTNAAFSNAAAQMGDGAAAIFSTYRRIASLQSPNGSQMGLRMIF